MAGAFVKKIEKRQIIKMWAIAKAIGMKDDDLYALADSDSLKSLSYIDAIKIIKRLEDLQGEYKYKRKDSKKTFVPGMISIAQQNKIWALMYELKKHDHRDVELADRLIGIIKFELKVEANKKNPFAWIDFAGANKLIEALKRYVEYAKKV